MDWLILILGVPAILVPLVLLFGFAGCGQPASRCTDDSDCAGGAQCIDGSCFEGSLGEPAPPPPSAPTNLVAVAIDDRSVSLTWINTDPATTDVQIERVQEDGDQFVAIPNPANLSPTSATDARGLLEGVTFIYQVRARLDGQLSAEASETAAATVFPLAPVLIATPVSINQIDLSWTNASAIATEVSLERSVSGGPFAEIFRGADTNSPFPDTGFDIGGLSEGTRYDYRIFAIVVDGFQNDVPQEVKSAPSATVPATTLAFTAAFTAPPGTLTTDQAGNEGACIVQRLSTALLTAGGTQVRIVLRGSTTGSFTLDKVVISQPAATGDPYDAAPDLTDVASGVTVPPNTAVTVAPVIYTLDPTKDLVVAFDISNTPGEGTLSSGVLPQGPLPLGGDTFASPATAEAGVPDRTSGYLSIPGRLFLIEKIEVL